MGTCSKKSFNNKGSFVQITMQTQVTLIKPSYVSYVFMEVSCNTWIHMITLFGCNIYNWYMTNPFHSIRTQHPFWWKLYTKRAHYLPSALNIKEWLRNILSKSHRMLPLLCLELVSLSIWHENDGRWYFDLIFWLAVNIYQLYDANSSQLFIFHMLFLRALTKQSCTLSTCNTIINDNFYHSIA